MAICRTYTFFCLSVCLVTIPTILNAALLVKFGHNRYFRNPASWRSNVIRYRFDDSLKPHEVAVIEKAFSHFENGTCIRFEQAPPKAKRTLILFRKAKNHRTSNQPGRFDRCHGMLGRQANLFYEQKNIIEGAGRCFKKAGTVVHEIMHAFGFLHEHQRADRDEHVRINWSNVREEKRKQFRVFSKGVNDMGSSYDFASIMHYPSLKFTEYEARRTIEIVNRTAFDESQLGQRERLSDGDKAALNRLFCDPHYIENQ